ncbi:hypothetical protein BI343_12235 [Chromobacterium amazonense]|nr:hypothetical protein BI343_12235 [Chromobacterium amazonense]
MSCQSLRRSGSEKTLNVYLARICDDFYEFFGAADDRSEWAKAGECGGAASKEACLEAGHIGIHINTNFAAGQTAKSMRAKARRCGRRGRECEWPWGGAESAPLPGEFSALV